MSEWNIYNLPIPKEEYIIIDIEKTTVTYLENNKAETRDMKKAEIVYDIITAIDCTEKDLEEGAQEEQRNIQEDNEESYEKYKQEIKKILKEHKELSVVEHFTSSASYENKWIISAREFSHLNSTYRPPQVYSPAKGDAYRPLDPIIIELAQVDPSKDQSILRFLKKYGLPYYTQESPQRITKGGQEYTAWETQFHLNECRTSMKLSEFKEYVVFAQQMIELAFQLSVDLTEINNNKLVTAVLYLLLFTNYTRIPNTDFNEWLHKLAQHAHEFLSHPMGFSIESTGRYEYLQKVKSVQTNLDYLELFIRESAWLIETERSMVAYYEPLQYSSKEFVKTIDVLEKIISALKSQYLNLEKIRSTSHKRKNSRKSLAEKRKIDIQYLEASKALVVPECQFGFEIMNEVYAFAQRLFCAIVNSHLCLLSPSFEISNDNKIVPHYRPSSLEDIMFLELYNLFSAHEFKKCIACDNIFTGFNRRSNMKYCSARCKNRIAQQTYRKKLKDRPTGTN